MIWDVCVELCLQRIRLVLACWMLMLFSAWSLMGVSGLECEIAGLELLVNPEYDGVEMVVGWDGSVYLCVEE